MGEAAGRACRPRGEPTCAIVAAGVTGAAFTAAACPDTRRSVEDSVGVSTQVAESATTAAPARTSRFSSRMAIRRRISPCSRRRRGFESNTLKLAGAPPAAERRCPANPALVQHCTGKRPAAERRCPSNPAFVQHCAVCTALRCELLRRGGAGPAAARIADSPPLLRADAQPTLRSFSTALSAQRCAVHCSGGSTHRGSRSAPAPDSLPGQAAARIADSPPPLLRSRYVPDLATSPANHDGCRRLLSRARAKPLALSAVRCAVRLNAGPPSPTPGGRAAVSG